MASRESRPASPPARQGSGILEQSMPESDQPSAPETQAPETRAATPPRRRGTKGAPPPQNSVLGALGDTPPASAMTAKPAKTARPIAEPPAEPAPEAPRKGKSKPAKPSKERTEPLNFRVTAEFRRAFKRAAAAQDCKKVDLLERIFADWQARNPG